MAYESRLPRSQRFVASAAVAAVTMLIGLGLIQGLDLNVARKIAHSIQAIAIPLPPAVPVVPAPAKDEAASGKAAPPNIKAKASPVEAPKPVIPPPKPSPLPAAPKAGDGREAEAGAAPTAGPGSGAGGQGDGTGAGGNGTGSGGGTRPVWQSGTIKDSDYPRSTSAAKRGGDVEVHFTIQPTGRVTHCRVRRSSGDSALDNATCRLIEARFRFRPATNAAGAPIASEYGWRQSWWLERKR